MSIRRNGDEVRTGVQCRWQHLVRHTFERLPHSLCAYGRDVASHNGLVHSQSIVEEGTRCALNCINVNFDRMDPRLLHTLREHAAPQ